MNEILLCRPHPRPSPREHCLPANKHVRDLYKVGYRVQSFRHDVFRSYIAKPVFPLHVKTRNTTITTTILKPKSFPNVQITHAHVWPLEVLVPQVR